MTESKYHIELHVKTGNDFQCYGKFFLGNNRKLANTIFRQLKGTRKVTEKTILHLDLVEAKNELPINIQIISCSLDELAENCKVITKEIFKFSNLEQV
jgi:hypothetical protein